MPQVEKLKLENSINIQFEETIEQCKTDKEDYIQEICDNMCIDQNKKPSASQMMRRFVEKGLSSSQAEGMAHLLVSAESVAQKAQVDSIK